MTDAQGRFASIVAGPGQAVRAGEAALVLAAYTALAVWWLWPLPAVMPAYSAYFMDENALVVADYYLIVWALAWDAHALATAPLGLFHANAFHPSTLALAYSEHFLGYAPLFAPVYWATGNPILAVNVLVLATYPLCGLGMYLLARRFTGRPAAAIAGFFYAFYLWRYQALAHLHLLGVHWMPLAIAFTERWLDTARRRDLALLGGALLLQALSSYYLAYALALAYGPYLLLALWRWRRRCDRRRVAGLGVTLAAVGVVVVALSLPYLYLRRLALIPTYGPGEAPAVGFIPMLGQRFVWDYLLRTGIGPVGYALGLLAIFPPWRRDRWPRLLGVVVAVVGVVAAFGMGIPVGGRVLWSPYRLLVDWVPGFSSLRLPSRFLLVAQLGLALLAGLGLHRVLRRAPAWVAWPVAVAAAVAALQSFAPLPALPLHREPTGDQVPPAHRWLARHGEGRPLLELPGAIPPTAARRMYLSTYHWLPIVDGYSAYPPATPAYLHRLAAGLPFPSALQELVDAVDVGWVLVHRDELGRGQVDVWAPRSFPGLEHVHEWEGDLLLRVTLPARGDRRDRLLSTSETLGGVPLARLGERCPGSLALAVRPPEPWRSASTARLTATVTNLGSAPWPAFGMVPRHLVRLRACVVRREQRPCAVAPIALPADVPAGGSVNVPFELPAPFFPGDYVLELNLVQVGDGPLEGCGVPPLRVPVRIEGASTEGPAAAPRARRP